ncbi:UPF0280 family protein [bacterium]|nr:UPF0280 family protein [bacterium]
MKYQTPFYRDLIKDDSLISYRVKIKQTDLLIRTEKDCRGIAEKRTKELRRQLEDYIESDPAFLHSFEPYFVREDAPEIVKVMAGASILAGVGPMAAVAGAIAELVGKELMKYSSEVIVENGGDIFLYCKKPRVVGIYAGESSPFSQGVGILVQPEETPLGICTSSGTVGPSFSFGEADAVAVIAPSAALADASATAIANQVRKNTPLEKAIKKAQEIEGLSGVVVIKGDKLVMWGKVNLVPIST